MSVGTRCNLLDVAFSLEKKPSDPNFYSIFRVNEQPKSISKYNTWGYSRNNKMDKNVNAHKFLKQIHPHTNLFSELATSKAFQYD